MDVRGRPCLAPYDASYYLYFVLPPGLRARSGKRLYVEVEYYGDRYGQFRLQYVSHDPAATLDGLYKNAVQRWTFSRSRITA